MIDKFLLLSELSMLFPDAKSELNYNNHFQFLVATILSAQTTDKAVNKITIKLFERYPNFQSLAGADLEHLKTLLNPLGLANAKAGYLIKAATIIHQKYQGQLPSSFAELLALPGVGRKVASLVLIELFDLPAFPVDTHILRVLNRLGLIAGGLKEAEQYLSANFFDYAKTIHHQLVLFGRYLCRSKEPKCQQCPFKNYCNYSTEILANSVEKILE